MLHGIVNGLSDELSRLIGPRLPFTDWYLKTACNQGDRVVALIGSNRSVPSKVNIDIMSMHSVMGHDFNPEDLVEKHKPRHFARLGQKRQLSKLQPAICRASETDSCSHRCKLS